MRCLVMLLLLAFNSYVYCISIDVKEPALKEVFTQAKNDSDTGTFVATINKILIQKFKDRLKGFRLKDGVKMYKTDKPNRLTSMMTPMIEKGSSPMLEIRQMRLNEESRKENLHRRIDEIIAGSKKIEKVKRIKLSTKYLQDLRPLTKQSVYKIV